MAGYNKHVWSVGEGIPSARLNNMEDEIDAIADLDYTFGGNKRFDLPLIMEHGATIEGFTPYLKLDDKTPTTGVPLILRNVEGKVQIKEYGGPEFIADLITHAHSGGVGGSKIDWSDVLNRFHAVDHLIGGTDPLSVGVPSNIGITNQEGSLTNHVRRDHVHAHPSGLGVDLHHNQAHGPSDHADRTHTKFIPGMAFWAQYQYTQITGSDLLLAGPELRHTVDDLALTTCKIPSGELFKLTGVRPIYLHLQNVGSNTGIALMEVDVRGMDDGDTSSSPLGSITDISASFSATKQYKRILMGTIDLSTGYDMISILVYRQSGEVADTLDESIILVGVEIVAESDQ